MRIIGVMLTENYKTLNSYNFEFYTYVGNTFTTLAQYEMWEVDEILWLEIKRTDLPIILEILEKNRLSTPLTYGGGINTVDDALEFIKTGVERVAIGSNSHAKINQILELSSIIGSEATLPIIDVSCIENRLYSRDNILLDELLLRYNEWSGEIMIQMIHRDGLIKCANCLDLTLEKIGTYSKLRFILSGSISVENNLEIKKFKNIGAIGVAREFNANEAAYAKMKGNYLD